MTKTPFGYVYFCSLTNNVGVSRENVHEIFGTICLKKQNVNNNILK